jgi:hypothetical protein
MRLAVEKGTNPILHERGKKESHGSVQADCPVPECGAMYAIYLDDNTDADTAIRWVQQKLKAEHDAGKKQRHPESFNLPPSDSLKFNAA